MYTDYNYSYNCMYKIQLFEYINEFKYDPT